jgi:hypothetical protein
MASIPDTIARLGATGPEAREVLKNRALAVLFDMADRPGSTDGAV